MNWSEIKILWLEDNKPEYLEELRKENRLEEYIATMYEQIHHLHEVMKEQTIDNSIINEYIIHQIIEEN